MASYTCTICGRWLSNDEEYICHICERDQRDELSRLQAGESSANDDLGEENTGTVAASKPVKPPRKKQKRGTTKKKVNPPMGNIPF